MSSSRYVVVPNYMSGTISSRNKQSIRKRYLDRKKIILKEVAEKAPDKNVALE